MTQTFRTPLLLAVSAVPLFWASASAADPLSCNLSAYKAGPGLAAQADGDALVLTWDGDAGQEARLRLTLNNRTPTVADVSLRPAGGAWTSVISNAAPDFAVVSGLRRMSLQQLEPLYDLKVAITQEVLDKYRWDPFWDTPLDVSAKIPGSNNPPPKDGLPGTNQPGLPRDPAEITRGEAIFAVTSCDVKTDGGRIEISFPGVTLGVFQGKLVYTVYKGSNLIKQEVIASTTKDWVA